MWHCNLFFSGANDIWFSFRGTIYQNNSLLTLEDIGEWNDALLCMTDLTACCQPPYASGNRTALGNWYLPNGTRVPSQTNTTEWDFFRTRDHSMILLHRRRGGKNGIYRCVIPDEMNVNQTAYIGLYSNNTGEMFVGHAQRVVQCCLQMSSGCLSLSL